MFSFFSSSTVGRFAVGLFAVSIVAVVLMSQARDDSQPEASAVPQSASSISGNPERENDITSFEQLSQEDINRMQKVANEAAVTEQGLSVVTAPLRSRPDFVSPLEWSVLKQVAASRDNSEQQLVNLVNNLRFNKQVDWWQQNHSIAPPALTDRVASVILESIPARVAAEDLDVGQAQLLQSEIIDAMVIDADQRQTMRQREAQKIGVVFDIQQAKEGG